MTSETDMDVKLELKTVMDKIRTLSMGKNKETIVSWVLILRLLVYTVMEHAVYLLLPRDLRTGVVHFSHGTLPTHQSICSLWTQAACIRVHGHTIVSRASAHSWVSAHMARQT